VEYYSISEKGLREQNEDNFIAENLNKLYLFAVADGLGGHSYGEMASKIAIGELKEAFIRKNDKGLQEGVIKANQTIFSENKRRQTDMGTTIVACILNERTSECIVAHVGDSRAYFFDDTLWKTKDHSLVQTLIDSGSIREEEAFQHPKKNIITKSLGLEENIDVVIDRKNAKNAIILLCSDGLSDYIHDEELAVIAKRYRPKEACEKLVKKALDNGSNDNITVIIINCMD